MRPPEVPTPWLGWKGLSSSGNEVVRALWSVQSGTKRKEGYQNDSIDPQETGNVGGVGLTLPWQKGRGGEVGADPSVGT